MDKEKLLSYFESNYMSRQEVLFKLPLNVQVDAFWSELLGRRKTRAVVLPLNNADGMPYWYTLTDKMIAASERLCEEALNQTESIDPYRTGMTSAMTEEMFFTSFVEGAQITFAESMDFLQRESEPENIQEQMIWNNRRAWEMMMGTLYRQIDEEYLKELAKTLTDGMDGYAEEYRQSDEHRIAAMNGEVYRLPTAFTLPDRMNELFSFLRTPETHPLIKAAAAQAFILVTRPFDEGNERLARMLSSAVLLRCGYDFFRDISISAVLAGENYRYYKHMREILRQENGSDLTYFMEYYMELLVRSADAKKERLRRREQDALITEMEMARQPLGRRIETVEIQTEQEPVQDIPSAETPNDDTDDEKTETPTPDLSAEEFNERLDEYENDHSGGPKKWPDKIRRMIDKGLYTFTVDQWAEQMSMDRKAADSECRSIYQKGLLHKDKSGSIMRYSFRIARPPAKEKEEESETQASEEETEPEKQSTGIPVNDDLERKLEKLEESKSEALKRSAQAIRNLLADGITSFDRQHWPNAIHMMKPYSDSACSKMLALGIIRNDNKKAHPAVYSINIKSEEEGYGPFSGTREKLNEMRFHGRDGRDVRIGQFLLQLIKKGRNRFTSMDWNDMFHMSKTVYGNDIRRALNLGLIQKVVVRNGDNLCVYELCQQIENGIRTDSLTLVQRRNLTELYESFHSSRFTVETCGKLLGVSSPTAAFHLKNFVERGLLEEHRHPGKAFDYSFKVTPVNCPECFIHKLDAENRGTATRSTALCPDRLVASAAV